MNIMIRNDHHDKELDRQIYFRKQKAEFYVFILLLHCIFLLSFKPFK